MILSQRIDFTQLDSDVQFARLVEFLKRHRTAADELTLFEDRLFHGYVPIEEFRERAALLGRRADQLRAEGFGRVGFNMRVTLGHIEEGWDFCPPLPFQAFVGQEGTLSKSCFCPNSKEFRQYIKEKYRLLAEARPDFIWADDDIRMYQPGVGYGCFCSECIDRFGLSPPTRARLVERLNAPDEGKLRAAWIANNTAVIEDLLKDIGGAVHEADPEIEMGLMTSDPFWVAYSGQELDRWLNALDARRARPGGGFWNDRVPCMAVHKAIDVARQCVCCPASVTNIQYEMESIPYQKLHKSAQSALNECTLALIAGCNGITFNALRELPGTFEDYEDLFQAVERERPRWEALVDAAEGLPLAGVWLAANDLFMAQRRVENADWFSQDQQYNVGNAYVLAEIGLPLTADKTTACASVLTGKMAEAFSDDELRSILSGGVLIDGTALQELAKRSLEHLAGVRVGRTYDNGVWELLTEHPLNGASGGHGRDARMSLWPFVALELLPMKQEVAALAQLVGYDGSNCGACMTAYENELGGRVITAAYAPLYAIDSSAKRNQIIALIDWASRQRLPIIIEKAVRVAPLIRMSADRDRFVAVLANLSCDPTGVLDVRVRAGVDVVRLEGPAGPALAISGKATGEVTMTLPSISPWNCAVLFGRKQEPNKE